MDVDLCVSMRVLRHVLFCFSSCVVRPLLQLGASALSLTFARTRLFCVLQSRALPTFWARVWSLATRRLALAHDSPKVHSATSSVMWATFLKRVLLVAAQVPRPMIPLPGV